MKFFEDSSSYSDSSSTRNSLYSTSSFSQSSPPLSSTPTSMSATSATISFNNNKPQVLNRPKSRTALSLNAQEFVPTPPLQPPTYGHYPNEYKCTATATVEGRNTSNANANVGLSAALPFPINMAASLNLLNSQAAQNQLFLQRQQILQEKHQLMQRQQELATKQQLILSATAAAKHPQDEIANSLKMFACLSACKGNEASQSPVDEVMQEFAANGYTTDDFNRYQQYQAASSMQMLANANIFTNSHNYDHANSLNPGMGNNINWHYQQQQLLQDNANNVYNEIWSRNFMQLMRQAEMANAAAVAAAAINMDYNRKTAKPFKRNFYKKEVPLAAKRCVFCDNNKEPEAVVKSHAVRDSQGRVLCPKLRVYVCPICHASGDDAHTVKYCPQKPIITMEDAIKADTRRIPQNTGAFVVAPKQQCITNKIG